MPVRVPCGSTFRRGATSTAMQLPNVPIDPEFVRALDKHGRMPRNSRRPSALLAAFLASDFHLTAAGTLPADVKMRSKGVLSGRHFLQIDEIVNIGAPLKGRFEEKGRGRTLKCHLTDGKQQVIGIEYRYIEKLSVNTVPGIKILVMDVFVHRGILFLCPENVDVLGGSVPRLVRAQEAAKTALTKTPIKGREAMKIDQVYREAELVAWEFESSTMPSTSSPAIPVTSSAEVAPSLRQLPSNSPAKGMAVQLSAHRSLNRGKTSHSNRSPVISSVQIERAAAVEQKEKSSPQHHPMQRLATQQREGTVGCTPPKAVPSFLKKLALPAKRSPCLEVVDLLESECVTPLRTRKPSVVPTPSLPFSEPPSKREFDVIDLLDDE